MLRRRWEQNMVSIGVEKHMLETTNVQQQTQYVVTAMSWDIGLVYVWKKSETAE